MLFTEELNTVKLALKKPLPGMSAQHLMAPKIRKTTDILLQENTNYRNSSVLLLLYPDFHGFMNTIFIERPVNNSVHSGQIALPGGKVDDDDINFQFTALREAEEEIGIRKETIDIIGVLTPIYVPASNFLIHPHIGVTTQTPDFIPNPTEVASLIPIKINDLLQWTPEEGAFKTSYGQLTAPGFRIGNHLMWGATSMIVSEFREMMR